MKNRLAPTAHVTVIPAKVGSKRYFQGVDGDTGEVLTTFRTKKEADGWAYKVNRSIDNENANLPYIVCNRILAAWGYLEARMKRDNQARIEKAAQIGFGF